MEIKVKVTEEVLNTILEILQEVKDTDSKEVDKIIFYK